MNGIIDSFMNGIQTNMERLNSKPNNNINLIFHTSLIIKPFKI